MRIFKDEAGLEERVFPIERHAIEEQHAFRIDEDFDVFKLEDMIARTRFGRELELVAEAGTATAQDAEAEAATHFFTSEGGADFINRFGRDVNLFGCAFNRGIPRLNFWRTRELS